MSELVKTIPATISALSHARTFVTGDIAYTLSIADLPFMQAPSQENPYVRDTADWRRQQFDNSKEAGEQSLDQAQWIRSQNSFHRGAGINFYEPGADDQSEFRFHSSTGLDVWTLGQVSLLHSMDNVVGGAGYIGVTGAVVGGTDMAFVNTAGTLKRLNGATVAAYTGTTAAVGEPVVAAGKVIVGSATGIWNGDPATPGALTHQVTVAASTRVWSAKSRLIVAVGNILYAMAYTDTALPGSPLYTHPDPTWVWSAITDTTDAILAAGYASGTGSIFRFSLSDPGGGGTPVLSSAFQIAEFPPGEEVHAIKVYLGAFIAIGTSRGVRIGAVTGATSISPTVIQYGPLLFLTGQPVTALTAADRYVYAGVQNAIDGTSGVARISLAEEIPNTKLQFPWAFDVQTHTTGVVDSLSILGASGRVLLGLHGTGAFLTSTTAYEPLGHLTTGNIRYATTESKAFRRARIRATYPTNTGVTLQTIAPNGSETLIARLDGDSATEDDLSVTRPQGQWEFLGFDLQFDSDGTDTPVLTSFQVKAIPAPKKQRLISYQILLSDHMSDANGAEFGGDGYAAAAMLALEQLESASAVVFVKDPDTGEGYEGTIDHQHLARVSPSQKNGANFGGMLTVVVRKL